MHRSQNTVPHTQKKGYNQHQLLALLLLKEYFKCGYRELIEMIQLMDILQKQLMLQEIPHYSTLCKFSDRVNSEILTKLLKSIYRFYPKCQNKKPVSLLTQQG